MDFSLNDIKDYLKTQTNLNDAINNLTEESVISSINIDNFLSSLPVTDKRTFFMLEKYEELIGMKKRITEQLNFFSHTKGVLGRYWLVCKPKWIGNQTKSIMKTDYDISYWINYGDGNTYGYFSVEQLLHWFDNPNIKLYEIGGTKES